MVQLILFLHLLGAIVMGYYLLMPFFAGKLASLSGETRKGFTSSVRMFNRIAQFVLIVQLLTGGYLLSGGNYSTLWWVVSVIIVILIGAFSGMMGAPLKRILSASVDTNASDVGRVRLFSVLVALLYLFIVIIMANPTLF